MALGMLVRGVSQGTADRPHLAAFGKLREMLADLQARRARLDRFELTTHIIRRIGLHVEAVVLGQAARKENIDHPLGRRRRTLHSVRKGGGPEGLQVVHPQAQQSHGPRLQGSPP